MYTVYLIQYKNLVYYGCTKRFNARISEHYMQIFSIAGAMRRNDLKCLKRKSLYEIAKELCDRHRWIRIIPLYLIQREVIVTTIAQINDIHKASELEQFLINNTENINRNSKKYTYK